MTRASPLHAADQATHFARMHRAQSLRQWRDTITLTACTIGLLMLAATTGYLAHPETTCAPAQITLD